MKWRRQCRINSFNLVLDPCSKVGPLFVSRDPCSKVGLLLIEAKGDGEPGPWSPRLWDNMERERLCHCLLSKEPEHKIVSALKP